MKFGVFRLRLHLFSGLAFLKRRCFIVRFNIAVIDSYLNIEDHYTHSQLSPFIYDLIRIDPLTVAQHNEQDFIVESILGHRNNRN
jgi:hypothetical protein